MTLSAYDLYPVKSTSIYTDNDRNDFPFHNLLVSFEHYENLLRKINVYNKLLLIFKLKANEKCFA